MKKYVLKKVKQSDWTRIFLFKRYPKDSKKTNEKGFVKLDNGEEGGTHWTCFV